MIYFWLNLVYVILVSALIVSGRLFEGAVLLGGYIFAGGIYGLMYLLPQHVKAKRLYGTPEPPLQLVLGLLNAELRDVLHRMKVVETKERRGILTKKYFCTLYELSIETEDGFWHYSLETQNDRLVAWVCVFESSGSNLLNFRKQSGAGSILRNDFAG